MSKISWRTFFILNTTLEYHTIPLKSKIKAHDCFGFFFYSYPKTAINMRGKSEYWFQCFSRTEKRIEKENKSVFPVPLFKCCFPFFLPFSFALCVFLSSHLSFHPCALTPLFPSFLPFRASLVSSCLRSIRHSFYAASIHPFLSSLLSIFFYSLQTNFLPSVLSFPSNMHLCGWPPFFLFLHSLLLPFASSFLFLQISHWVPTGFDKFIFLPLACPKCFYENGPAGGITDSLDIPGCCFCSHQRPVARPFPSVLLW